MLNKLSTKSGEVQSRPTSYNLKTKRRQKLFLAARIDLLLWLRVTLSRIPDSLKSPPDDAVVR